MAQLLKALENDDHSHIILVKDDGTGTTSPGLINGHVHDVFIDENGIVIVEEADGHGHESIQVELEEEEKPSVKGRDEEILDESLVLLRQAIEIDRDFRTRGKTAYDFYKGDQWKAQDRSDLEANQRAAITVNEIRSLVNALSGLQRQNRTDIKYLSIEKHSPMGAEIANIIVKWILDKSNFAHHESKVFIDGLVTGRGLWNLFSEEDKNGNILLLAPRFRWDMVFFGPHEEEDLRDLEYQIKSKWFSLAKLKAMYPIKAKELEQDMERVEDRKFHIVRKGQQYTVDQDNAATLDIFIDNELVVDVQKKSFRLFELYRKKYQNIKKLLYTDDDGNEITFDDSCRFSKEDFRMGKKIEGVSVVNTTDFHIEVITFAGETILDKRISLLDDFMVIPYYVSKDDDYIQGKVESLIDLQKEINKRHSQAIDVVNRANNDGWFYDDQTFANRNEERKFEEQANAPGWSIKLRDMGRVPQKVERGRFPSELVNMRELASSKMRQISGINEEVLGEQSNAKSGVAIMRRLRQGMVVNDFLFDNLSLSKKKLGEVIIKMVQKLYGPEDIIKILRDQNIQEKINLPVRGEDGVEQVELDVITDETLLEFLRNEDFTTYSVSISESANTPTKNMDRFIALTEVMSQGILNPISIELAKQAGILSPAIADKFNAMLQEQAQVQAQSEQAKNQTELLKSGVPPQIVQQI